MRKHLKNAGKEIIKILFICIVIVLFNYFIAQRVVVIGNSMQPAYEDKENLVMERVSYYFTDPERFDVVVIDTKSPYGIIIKRIIGLPGETIQIEEDGSILINGMVLKESYGLETINPELRGRAEYEITLKEDEYFVLGDNRNNSGDSRLKGIGNIEKNQILGKIIIKIPFIKGDNI